MAGALRGLAGISLKKKLKTQAQRFRITGQLLRQMISGAMLLVRTNKSGCAQLQVLLRILILLIIYGTQKLSLVKPLIRGLNRL